MGEEKEEGKSIGRESRKETDEGEANREGKKERERREGEGAG